MRVALRGNCRVRAKFDTLVEDGTEHATECRFPAMNETHPPPELAPGDYRSIVLDRLSAAGPKGISASHLVDTKKPVLKAERQKALAELVMAGELQEQRKGKVVRFWSQGQMPVVMTPEERADEVLRRVLPEQRRGRLFTPAKLQSELLKGLAIKEPAVQTCLRLLEQQRLLIKLTDGTKTFYTYAPALREWLAEAVPEEVEATVEPESTAEAEAEVNLSKVVEAYRTVRVQRRMPDIEIARLQEELGCSADDIKPLVQQLCEQGVFIPGKGDWSFASPAARAAAILVQNEPYLFVRMKEE